MIDYPSYSKLKELQNQGLNPAQIAKAIGLNPRTVRKWMQARSYSPRRAQGRRASKLDPFKDQIKAWLEQHAYSSAQLLPRLRERGYTGGKTILTDYVAQIRPATRAAFLTLHFAPGDCAQVDWGQFKTIQVGGTRRRLSLFVMTLAHSRKMYLEFTVTERMEQWLECHVNAFRFFGGVPDRVMIDNLKSGVLDHPYGGEPRFHPRFLELASHYDFTPVAHPVRKPHHKGRVERNVSYIKGNFLNGRALSSLELLNQEAQRWLAETANSRLHKETRRKPEELFLEAEKEALSGLPLNRFDASNILSLRANRQYRIHYDGNRYSVPCSHAGKRIALKAYAHQLLIYDDQQLIAKHARSYDRGQNMLDPEHEAPLLKYRKRARDQRLHERFLKLCPQATLFLNQLKQRRLNALSHVRRIVALVDVYGEEAVGRALEDAHSFQAYSAEYILNILQQRSRKQPEAGPLHVPHKGDLLDIELPAPDLTLYTEPQKTEAKETP